MNQMNPFSFSYQNNTSTKLMGFARLKKEYEVCSQDEDLMQIGCNFSLYDNNLFIWKVSMVGERNTPYEGGMFTIKILFPENYPKNGPEFRFMTKIYHLNVDLTNPNVLGHISLSSLNEWQTTGQVKGRSVYGVKQALFDIFWLFSNQDASCSYDEEMDDLYKKNREEFNKMAKKWTEQYAKI